MAEQKLKLRGCEIVFANMEEKDGFKRSLTIKVDAEKEKAITEFWKANKIGKTDAGKPNFKDYEGTKQMNLSFNDNTKFAYLNGTNEQSLGWGAKVDLVVNAFTYNNKFTGGKDKVGASLSAVLVTSGRVTGADADLADLLSGYEVADSNDDEAKAPTLSEEDKAAEDDLPVLIFNNMERLKYTAPLTTKKIIMKRNKSLHGMVINQAEYKRLARDIKAEFVKESGVQPTRVQLCKLFTDKYGGGFYTNYNRLTRFKI